MLNYKSGERFIHESGTINEQPMVDPKINGKKRLSKNVNGRNFMFRPFGIIWLHHEVR
jgi:hypothetical protein